MCFECNRVQAVHKQVTEDGAVGAKCSAEASAEGAIFRGTAEWLEQWDIVLADLLVVKIAVEIAREADLVTRGRECR